MLSLSDKVAVVTGAGGDIGRAASVALSKQGADLRGEINLFFNNAGIEGTAPPLPIIRRKSSTK